MGKNMKNRLRSIKTFHYNLKIEKIIEIPFFLYGICPKKHEILGNFRFFTIRNTAGNP